MHEIIITMIHNPPARVEQLQATEWLCINKLNIVNHFCMLTIIDQINPWGIFKHKNYRLHWMNGGSTIIIATTNWNGRHRSIWRADLRCCQRMCELFVKCSLSHSHKWLNWSWQLKTAWQLLNEHSGMLQQCYISGQPWFHFFQCVGTIN